MFYIKQERWNIKHNWALWKTVLKTIKWNYKLFLRDYWYLSKNKERIWESNIKSEIIIDFETHSMEINIQRCSWINLLTETNSNWEN